MAMLNNQRVYPKITWMRTEDTEGSPFLQKTSHVSMLHQRTRRAWPQFSLDFPTPSDEMYHAANVHAWSQKGVAETLVQVPSGKLTELWKITMFNGKTHYFYGHFQ